jgi:hypothetical protein
MPSWLPPPITPSPKINVGDTCKQSNCNERSHEQSNGNFDEAIHD